MGGKSQIPGVEEDRLDTEKRRKRRTFVWSAVCSLIFGFVLAISLVATGLVFRGPGNIDNSCNPNNTQKVQTSWEVKQYKLEENSMEVVQTFQPIPKPSKYLAHLPSMKMPHHRQSGKIFHPKYKVSGRMSPPLYKRRRLHQPASQLKPQAIRRYWQNNLHHKYRDVPGVSRTVDRRLDMASVRQHVNKQPRRHQPMTMLYLPAADSVNTYMERYMASDAIREASKDYSYSDAHYENVDNTDYYGEIEAAMENMNSYGKKYNKNNSWVPNNEPVIIGRPHFIHDSLNPHLLPHKYLDNEEPIPSPSLPTQPPSQPIPYYQNPTTSHNLQPNMQNDQINLDKTVQTSFHPDGPDYSTGTIIRPPMRVGMDLYPIDKQDMSGSTTDTSYPHDFNKHQIIVHINLYSKNPYMLDGRNTLDSDKDHQSSFDKEMLESTSENNEMNVEELPAFVQTDVKDDALAMGDHAILSKKQDIGNCSIHSQDNSLKEAKNIDVKEIFKNNQKEKKNVNHSSTVRIEYDYDFLENPTEKDERNETKDDKPEYYYYYYYDNIDPAFKNSDELFTSENHSYEPLPTPLSVVSDILDGATIASNADGQDKKTNNGE